ncbi:MAG: hypothetical protein NZM12_07870, partial [Steroidobacteraceae bacterium]|nr:hypothetical protein [Steroidobacteraceae bacterium]MDW8259178.1 phage tail sheath C-terminal domain-containing protein [Gammaproteobacteria bacterium]
WTVAERALSGFTIAEQNGPEHAIARVSLATAAFVGRALKGPVNTPVSIGSFTEFQRIFGGLWQPAPLSYAVEQFFDSGGRQAIVVRVVNGGRPPTISLPAGTDQLRLIGLCPGTREYLRASVDYDGIAPHETDLFNLVIQRTQGPGSERVEDQEIFRRISVRSGAPRFVADALTESQLVRVCDPIPPQRPNRSPPAPGGAVVGYTGCNPDGDDGLPISDYDVIGAAQTRSGLFALEDAPPFGMLCIPPLSREQDVGLSTWLIAARLCRRRHALLIVDPPAAWSDPALAFAGARQWPLRADNAVMFFPRVLALDRLRGRVEIFANCGTVAGLLARADESQPLWVPQHDAQITLRPGLRPACLISETQRLRLMQCAVNVLEGPSIRPAVSDGVPPLRTLADGNLASSDWRYLRARRLALMLTASIEQGTRWTIFEKNDATTWQRVRAQVEAFLAALDRDGAFLGGGP